MANLDWKDIWGRALWTFGQAFTAAAAASGADFVSVAVWKSAAIAGGAAVISFAKNVFAQSSAK